MWQQLPSLNCTVESHFCDILVHVRRLLRKTLWLQIGLKKAAHACLHPGTTVWFDIIWGQGRGRLESKMSRGRLPLNHFILSRLGVIKLLFSLTIGRVGRQVACHCYQLLLRTGFYFSQIGRLHFFISCSVFLIKKCLIRLCRSGCFLTPVLSPNVNRAFGKYKLHHGVTFDCHCCKKIQSIIHPSLTTWTSNVSVLKDVDSLLLYALEDLAWNKVASKTMN